MKTILFGAGKYSENVIKILGKDNIEYILDNDKNKEGKKIVGIPVHIYSKNVEGLHDLQIVIAVSEQYEDEIKKQLENDGIKNYKVFREVKVEITRERILGQMDGVSIYRKAIDWVKSNSLDGKCIICNSNKKKGYPEVTGYYIPTLIRWGYKDLAKNYAKWLISIQQEDGSWMDTDGADPYIFDTAQILKGLISIREIFVEGYASIDASIKKGCEWIIGKMTEEGRLITPSTKCWGNDESVCSELIHLYCLSPIKQAALLFGELKYANAVEKISNYYISYYQSKILNFSLLSHFYAYVMEALLDLGFTDMCREAMAKIGEIQRPSGAVPAYNNVDWVCSTGIFQLALVWFRLGDIERGNKAFEYACKLQNDSGGWYGSYLSENNPNEENTYFPFSEISWANKYFLDALYYKMQSEFEYSSESFLDNIDQTDGRYQFVRSIVKDNPGGRILDLGCGKGRYVRKLAKEFPENKYYAVDISSKVMRSIDEDTVEKKVGTITNIPYDNDYFDVVYSCEALEHAVDIESSIKEIIRVLKPGGDIVIVDKNRKCLGLLYISSWEQWFDVDELKGILCRYCESVEVEENIKYESGDEDLLCAWNGKKKNEL